MAKKKSVKNNISCRSVIFFRWKKKKEFTVLEDFVVQILEQKGALSDAEIARILCLEEGDVADIIDDSRNEYEDDIQGDESRRSLCDGFSRELPDGIAVAVGGKGKDKSKDEPIEIDNTEGAMAAFLDRCSGTEKNNRLNSDFKKFRKFRKEKNAKTYELKISYNFNDSANPDFRYNEIPLPEQAHKEMRKLLLPKEKSGEKIAQPPAPAEAGT